MPRAVYGGHHQRQRAALELDSALCAHCEKPVGHDGKPGVADHQPPLALHDHVIGSGCCEYVPSCATCSSKQAGAVTATMRRTGGERQLEVVFDEPDACPISSDPIWSVPWLADLLEIPADATWPRFMSAPHPRATGSLGHEFEAFVLERDGRVLRWWQRLVARRVLEVDDAGSLVWVTWLLTVARQVGKSWLIAELLLFALVHVRRLALADDVLLVGRTLALAELVLSDAMLWADDQGEPWKAHRRNGGHGITYDRRHTLSVRAAGSVYGSTNGLAVIDEAWDVQSTDVSEGIRPSITAAEGQLGLVSTAHRRATSLYLNERQRAFEQLDEPRNRLLLEWSAHRERAIDDELGWREASPYWTERRRDDIADALEVARSGERLDVSEPDPIAGFEAQWLNRWPVRQTTRGAGDPLFGPGDWAQALHTAEQPVFARVAVLEDNYGRGSSVVIGGMTAEERVAVQGVMFDDREAAFEYLRSVAGSVEIVLLSGLVAYDPAISTVQAITELTGPAELRRGLSTVRDLMGRGELVHDGSPDLASQVLECRLRESTSGLQICSRGRNDVVRAMAGAIARVQRYRQLGSTVVL